ncbi:MAG: TIGR03435 family protein [Acidobacteriota bacterium]
MHKHILILSLAAGVAFGQTRQFEVATIRPADPITAQSVQSGKLHVGMNVRGNQVDIGYMTLRELAATAYDVKPLSIQGPEWLTQQRYDILALMPDGATNDDIPVMLQALLKDRFKMVAHKESKEEQVFALEVAKGGHKLKEAPPVVEAPKPAEDEAKPAAGAKPQPGMVVSANGQEMRINQTQAAGGGMNMSIAGGKNGAQKISMGADGQMHLEVERVTMAELAEMLTPMLEYPVFDHTDLKGAFQVALDLSMADLLQVASKAGLGGATAGNPVAAGRLASIQASADPGGAIIGSIQKLGLRLEKQKGQVGSLVIDSAEKKPSEN